MPDLDLFPTKMMLLHYTASLFRLFCLERLIISDSTLYLHAFSLSLPHPLPHPLSLSLSLSPSLSPPLSLYMEEVDCKLDMQQLRWSTTRQGDPQ